MTMQAWFIILVWAMSVFGICAVTPAEPSDRRRIRRDKLPFIWTYGILSVPTVLLALEMWGK